MEKQSGIVKSEAESLVYLCVLSMFVICLAFLLRQDLAMYPRLASNLLYFKPINAFDEFPSSTSLKMPGL